MQTLTLGDFAGSAGAYVDFEDVCSCVWDCMSSACFWHRKGGHTGVIASLCSLCLEHRGILK